MQLTDVTLLPYALMIWPAAKALVFMGAATVDLWSRKPGRRAEARRIMRILTNGDRAAQPDEE